MSLKTKIFSLREELPALSENAEGELRGGFVAMRVFSANDSAGGDGNCSNNIRCSGNGNCSNNVGCYGNGTCKNVNNSICTAPSGSSTSTSTNGNSDNSIGLPSMLF